MRRASIGTRCVGGGARRRPVEPPARFQDRWRWAGGSRQSRRPCPLKARNFSLGRQRPAPISHLDFDLQGCFARRHAEVSALDSCGTAAALTMANAKLRLRCWMSHAPHAQSLGNRTAPCMGAAFLSRMRRLPRALARCGRPTSALPTTHATLGFAAALGDRQNQGASDPRRAGAPRLFEHALSW